MSPDSGLDDAPEGAPEVEARPKSKVVPSITEESHGLFLGLFDDVGNWSGTPLADVTKEQRGNLTDLKRKKLITTFNYDGDPFATITTKGLAYAKEQGRDISLWLDGTWPADKVEGWPLDSLRMDSDTPETPAPAAVTETPRASALSVGDIGMQPDWWYEENGIPRAGDSSSAIREPWFIYHRNGEVTSLPAATDGEMIGYWTKLQDAGNVTDALAVTDGDGNLMFGDSNWSEAVSAEERGARSFPNDRRDINAHPGVTVGFKFKDKFHYYRVMNRPDANGEFDVQELERDSNGWVSRLMADYEVVFPEMTASEAKSLDRYDDVFVRNDRKTYAFWSYDPATDTVKLADTETGEIVKTVPRTDLLSSTTPEGS